MNIKVEQQYEDPKLPLVLEDLGLVLTVQPWRAGNQILIAINQIRRYYASALSDTQTYPRNHVVLATAEVLEKARSAREVVDIGEWGKCHETSNDNECMQQSDILHRCRRTCHQLCSCQRLDKRWSMASREHLRDRPQRNAEDPAQKSGRPKSRDASSP